MNKVKVPAIGNTRYKVCTRCNLRKPIKSFDKQTQKGVTYYKPYCSNCKSKAYRKRNPEGMNARSIIYKERYRAKQLTTKLDLMKAINQTVCKQCGYSDIRALTFHHLIPKDKLFSISYGFTHSYAYDTLLAEAKKCDVLCMNCHTLIHCKLKLE